MVLFSTVVSLHSTKYLKYQHALHFTGVSLNIRLLFQCCVYSTLVFVIFVCHIDDLRSIHSKSKYSPKPRHCMYDLINFVDFCSVL